ncbi:hypothetical protein [Streptomyces omiyaensis]|uniref:hypothetical protein n=1 Tax=Streptomyces omiyaensis TaxID=68247 RepID=UPI0016748E12|nr:hypothetical protein [Streptomyces omiyaensis]
MTVQAGFGYSAVDPDIVWTDITQWVKTSGGGAVSITRGAADERADTQTGTLSLSLDNRDGRFTPGNASSPYTPNVRRNTPVRVLKTVLNGKNFLVIANFESSATSAWGWAADPAAAPQAYARDNTRANTGSWSMKVTWAGTGTGGVLRAPVHGLPIGVSCTASAYVYVPAGSPAVVIDIDGTHVSAPSSVTGSWQRLSVTWTTTSASAYMRITTASAPPAAGTMAWMDSAQVEEGAAATAWSSNVASYHARFFGIVGSWPVKWSGLHSTVTLTASDMMKWLGRRPSLGPMLVEEVQGDGAALYYPLSEPSSSVSGGDQSGASRPSLTIRQSGSGGTLEFGTGTGPPADELPAPTFTPASASAGKSLQCRVTPLLTSDGSTGTPIPGTQVWEVWLSTSTPGRCVLKLSTGTAPAFESGVYFMLESGTGRLQAVEFLFGGGSTTTLTAATPTLADGAPHHLVWDEASGDVWVDGVQYALGIGAHSDMALLTVGSTAGNSAFPGTDGTLHWAGTVSHVAAYVRNGVGGAGPAVADIVDHYDAGMTGHAGELSSERMSRLAGYARIPTVTSSGSFSPVASQGVLGQAPVTHMRDVERTESGRLFAARDGAALLFQSRSVRYNPTSAVTLAYSDLETLDVEMADDDQKQVNVVEASRPGGATQRIQSDESIARDGIYQQQLTVLKVTDAEVIDAATWQVIRYADPQPELRQLPVEASTLAVATYRALLDADISTVVTVTGMPAEAPAPTAISMVEGYVERITEAQHQLDFHTSRADLGSVWVLGDPTYSVLGTTTRLAY